MGSSKSSNPTPLSEPKERMKVLDLLLEYQHLNHKGDGFRLHSKTLHLSATQLRRL